MADLATATVFTSCTTIQPTPGATSMPLPPRSPALVFTNNVVASHLPTTVPGGVIPRRLETCTTPFFHPGGSNTFDQMAHDLDAHSFYYVCLPARVEGVYTSAEEAKLQTDGADETDDVVLVHTIDLESSVETRDKLKYAKQYPLVLPSYKAKLHDERRAAVVNYFAREPELEDGEQHAIALSKLVVTALRENAGWIDDHVCSLCLDKRGGAAIVLACPCLHEIYHRVCGINSDCLEILTED
ncbi:hypothetical protein B0H13DRAFT_2394372 [Mycena leptocephala]|nr:hypothetical protein B0H13DRAFT_2394372 [Mycena leptocephala]